MLNQNAKARPNGEYLISPIATSDSKYMTPARQRAIQSARLLCHLIEQTNYACPEAATALYVAAKAVTVDALNRIEIAEREANFA